LCDEKIFSSLGAAYRFDAAMGFHVGDVARALGRRRSSVRTHASIGIACCDGCHATILFARPYSKPSPLFHSLDVIVKQSKIYISAAQRLAWFATICFGVVSLASFASAQSLPPPPSTPPVPGPPSTIRPDPPGLAACVFPKLTAWIGSQHPQAPYPAMMAKKDELIAECSKQLHVDIAERCDTLGTESAPDQRRSADAPVSCQSTVPGSDTVIIWHPVHGSIFEKQRPTDGRFADGWLAIYEAILKPRVEQPRQGDPPDTLYALLYYDGGRRTLFPLNYATEDPQHIQLPSRGPAQLAVALDSHRHTYLLYAPSLSFLTPSWDSTQASLEHFYVWWLDPQKKIVRRALLPQGPWVDDAKLDKILARDVRNFSCGTGCYRNYEFEADSGNIFVTISGRTSAVSEKVLGTYKLGQDDTKWSKIRDGKPSE
jgi:hypothetical protein